MLCNGMLLCSVFLTFMTLFIIHCINFVLLSGISFDGLTPLWYPAYGK